MEKLGISIIEMVTNILKDSIRGVEGIIKRLVVILEGNHLASVISCSIWSSDGK